MKSTLPIEILEYGKAHKKTYKAIYKAIERYDKIVVFRHIKPDFDAMGSQMGLVTFIKDNFPNKEVHFVGDNHVNFTGRIFPETESLNNEWFTGGNYLSIIVDVGDKPRIADPRFKSAKYKVKIDHHPCKDEVAKRCSLVDTESSACCEMIADLLLNWKGTKISKTAAEYLYIGLVGDNGRFMYSSTNTHSFAVASELLKCGIDLPSLYLKMYEKTLHSLEIMGHILSHYSVSEHGVAYYILSDEDLAKLQITSELGKENVNLFSNIAGVNAWCSITQDSSPKDPCWRISIRSKKVDISKVANKWEGGGHAQASGAKIKDLTQLNDFIKDLDDLFI